MLRIFNTIKEFLQHISDIIADLENTLEISSDETLVIHKNNGKPSFYLRSRNSPPRYISHSNTRVLCHLAQNRYDKEALAILKKQQKAIKRCITILNKKDLLVEISSIYESFPAELKPMIKPHADFNGEYARRWQARRFSKSSWKQEEYFKSKRGELVRSKSELIIANKLYDEGIPYHYEIPFYVDGQFFSRPDFFILNPRTRKEYLWEHFGRMSNEEYLNETLNKINVYSKCGYVQGDNFIATFECDNHPLNLQHVDKIIETLLK